MPESLENLTKEALALELYRQDRIAKKELSQLLGVDRIDTNALLQRHRVYKDALTLEDLEADHKTLHELFSKGV